MAIYSIAFIKLTKSKSLDGRPLNLAVMQARCIVKVIFFLTSSLSPDAFVAA